MFEKKRKTGEKEREKKGGKVHSAHTPQGENGNGVNWSKRKEVKELKDGRRAQNVVDKTPIRK